MKRSGTILFSIAIRRSGDTHLMWSRKLGCHRSMVTKMVSGDRIPMTYALRRKIESLMHVPPDSWDRWSEG